ncbi:MAG TPA: hypothetical protein VK453_21205 [Micromonosporaceae bacterium]|nr:hypothetical protein [Micromonosporaceae bacterium]
MSMHDGSSGATPPGQYASGNMAPPPPYGGPTAPAQPSERGTNGLAVAGLVLAFLLAPVGFVLSIIAFVQAGKRGQRGKGLAIAGIVVSILVMASAGAAVYALGRNASTIADPGCVAGKAAILDNAGKMDAAGDPAAAKAVIQTTIDELTAASGKSKKAAVRSALDTLVQDYTTLLQAINTGTPPDPGFEAKVTADGEKLDSLCTLGAGK